MAGSWHTFRTFPSTTTSAQKTIGEQKTSDGWGAATSSKQAPRLSSSWIHSGSSARLPSCGREESINVICVRPLEPYARRETESNYYWAQPRYACSPKRVIPLLCRSTLPGRNLVVYCFFAGHPRLLAFMPPQRLSITTLIPIITGPRRSSCTLWPKDLGHQMGRISNA
jgi:hypothetical protein